MRRFSWILLAAALSACARSPEPLSEGEAYFKGLGCVRCHSVGGEGGKYGPDLSFVGFRKDAAWLDQWLQDPHAWRDQTVMPDFNLPERIRAPLVQYLAGLKGQAFEKTGKPWEKPELQGDPVAKGAVLFDTVGCVTCHGQRGKGGYPNNNVVGGRIPALTLVSDGYSKGEFHELLEKGREAVAADPSKPGPMLRMPPWGQVLTTEEIDALAAFVWSLKPAGAGGDEW
jgi:mono/diheme cytochrome c family protein